MKEINISKTLIEERHKKGITQEELAEYIGVSKAAVSKWESERSYPDIMLLPQLATYFNISIDELIGYEPQMEREDIKKLYHRLSEDFAKKPFNEVMKECDDIIKKYYSCFPLLLQMGVLLLNHGVLSENPQEIYKKALELSERVKIESEDVNDAKEAAVSEIICYIALNQPQKALELQGEKVRPMLQETELLAQTYHQMGNVEKAMEVTQICIYQHLLYLAGDSSQYLMLNADNMERAEEIIRRTIGIVELFDMEKLHPNTSLSIYFSAATVYSSNKKIEKAIDMLERYVKICIEKYLPFTLHGDSYFNMIDKWFDDFGIGNKAPRNEKLLKVGLVNSVIENPVFLILEENQRYKKIKESLTKFKGC